MIANIELREYANRHGVRIWEIAHAFGYSDANFTRRIREELPEDLKQEWYKCVDELSKGNSEYKNNSMKQFFSKSRYKQADSRTEKLMCFFDNGTKAKIKNYAAEQGISMNEFMNRLVKSFFKENVNA